MNRRDAFLLLCLSAIWGASFLFIKLGVERLQPSVVVLGRVLVGTLVLLPLVAARGGLGPLRGRLRSLVVLSALNNALPFWLLGFAETRLDSGLTADQRSATDARANRDVDRGVEVLRGAPTRFAEHRCLIVAEGDAFRCARSGITVNPAAPGDFRRLLELTMKAEGGIA